MKDASYEVEPMVKSNCLLAPYQKMKDGLQSIDIWCLQRDWQSFLDRIAIENRKNGDGPQP